MQVLGDASLHGGKVKCVIWTAEWLISCGIAGVMFWDARCLELVRQCACPSPLCDLALWGCYAFGISASGSLLLFKPKCTRILPLDAEVFALSCVGELVVVGCTAGIIRLFQMATLAYVGDFPRPPPLGLQNATSQRDLLADDDQPQSYPSTLCVRLLCDGTSTRVAAAYADRSLLVWDVEIPYAGVKYRSFLHHSSCIWDLKCFEKKTKDDSPGLSSTISE